MLPTRRPRCYTLARSKALWLRGVRAYAAGHAHADALAAARLAADATLLAELEGRDKA